MPIKRNPPAWRPFRFDLAQRLRAGTADVTIWFADADCCIGSVETYRARRPVRQAIGQALKACDREPLRLTLHAYATGYSFGAALRPTGQCNHPNIMRHPPAPI